MTERERIEEKERLEAEVRKQGQNHKSMRDITSAVLNSRIGKDTARKLVGESYLEDLESLSEGARGQELTLTTLLTARMVKAVIEDGNVKAMEYLRDTSGNKPTERKEVAVDIMTDNDRALIDKVSQRLTENG